MTDHFVVLVDVGCSEVNQNIYNKHDIYNEVDDRQWVFVTSLHIIFVALFAFLAEQKRGDVRCEDGCVDDEQKDDPVPHSLERRVMKNRALVYPWRLEFVLW